MNWTLGISILVIAISIIVVIYLIGYQLKKNKYLQLRNDTISNWGKPKSEEYFNFDSIEQYFINTNNKDNSYHIITEQIKNDLDINELFKYLDRTTSKIGQQYLYYKIRVVESKEKLLKGEQLAAILESNSELRINCQSELAKLNSYDAYDVEKLIHEKGIVKPTFQKLLIPLTALSILFLVLGFFHPVFFLVLLPVFMVNLVLHYKTKSYINYYLNAVNQLNISLSIGEKLMSFTEIFNCFNKIDFHNKLKEIRVKTRFISFEKQLNNDFTAIIWSVVELIKILFNIEAIVFYSFVDVIDKKRNDIDELFCFIGEIDSALAVASIRYKNDRCCKPNFVTEKQLKVKEVIHPLIEDCIANSLELDKESLLLTGSNMSGKTTFIRTIAINSILAQTLNIAFAKEFSIPYFKVFSSIRISDDLFDNTSYYLEEVLTIKQLIEVSQQEAPCLFVLDEIFKGTNTIERISGGKAILSYLNNNKDFVFVSTHDIELTEFLKNDNFELFHFSELIKDNALFFDHKLKRGKLQTRNAIKILELYNYPQQIIDDAKNTEEKYFD